MITLHPHNRKTGVRKKFLITDKKRIYWGTEQLKKERAKKHGK